MPYTDHIEDCKRQIRRVQRTLETSRVRLAHSAKTLETSDGRVLDSELRLADDSHGQLVIAARSVLRPPQAECEGCPDATTRSSTLTLTAERANGVHELDAHVIGVLPRC